MADWTTVADLSTAAGTLVLAAATFASVRSSNRSARLAERSLQVRLRPLLLPSRLEDPTEKVGFQDEHWVRVQGGHTIAEVGDNAIYLATALRNAGDGLAVLNGWTVWPRVFTGADQQPPDGSAFRRLTRDLYIAAGTLGFWQGTYRDPSDPAFSVVAEVIKARARFTIDVLYGDGEGGQRTISRFGIIPAGDNGWITAVSHHWFLDRPNPR
jgi:hypothetical protein